MTDYDVQFAPKYLVLGFDQLHFHSVARDKGAFLGAYGRDILPQLH